MRNPGRNCGNGEKKKRQVDKMWKLGGIMRKQADKLWKWREKMRKRAEKIRK